MAERKRRPGRAALPPNVKKVQHTIVVQPETSARLLAYVKPGVTMGHIIDKLVQEHLSDAPQQ